MYVCMHEGDGGQEIEKGMGGGGGFVGYGAGPPGSKSYIQASSPPKVLGPNECW